MKYSLSKTVESSTHASIIKKRMFAELFSSMEEGDLINIKKIVFEAKSTILEAPSNIFNGLLKYEYGRFTEYRLEVFTDSKVFITEKDMEAIRIAMINYVTVSGKYPSVIHMSSKTIKAVGQYLSEKYPTNNPANGTIFIWGLRIIEDDRLPYKEFEIK